MKDSLAVLATLAFCHLPGILSVGITCYSCSTFVVDKSVDALTDGDLRAYVGDKQTFGLITGALSTGCNEDSYKQCGGDRCISSHLRLQSVEDGGARKALGTISLHDCGAPWLEKDDKFCRSAETGISDSNLDALCYMETCTENELCNIPSVLLADLTTPFTPEAPTQAPEDNLEDDSSSGDDETDDNSAGEDNTSTDDAAADDEDDADESSVDPDSSETVIVTIPKESAITETSDDVKELITPGPDVKTDPLPNNLTGVDDEPDESEQTESNEEETAGEDTNTDEEGGETSNEVDDKSETQEVDGKGSDEKETATQASTSVEDGDENNEEDNELSEDDETETETETPPRDGSCSVFVGTFLVVVSITAACF